MFNSARIKLTAWYLFIITLITLAFSVAMFKLITVELDRFERAQRFRYELRIPTRPILDPDLIEDAKNHLLLTFGLIDLSIIGVSAVAGYFLAGRTLKPIKEMVDEQNQFITDASHELRTPLTSLKTSSEVFLRNHHPTLEESTGLIKSNLEEINNLQALTDNLIKLAQYQKGNGNIVFEQISISEVVEEATKRIDSLAQAKRITIKNNVREQKLTGSKQSLGELLVILLDNAIKYSPINSTITLASRLSDNTMTVSVKDEGPGIDKQDLPHLFDRFYRADKSRQKIGAKGYGLGLSIAKQIVDQHHGTVSVESETNQGTTFFVRLPLRGKF